MLSRFKALLRAPVPLPRAGGGLAWLEGPALETRPVRSKRQALACYAGWVHAAASTLAQDVRGGELRGRLRDVADHLRGRSPVFGAAERTEVVLIIEVAVTLIA